MNQNKVITVICKLMKSVETAECWAGKGYILRYKPLPRASKRMKSNKMILTEVSNTNTNLMESQENKIPVDNEVALDEKTLSSCDVSCIHDYSKLVVKSLDQFSYNTLEDSISQENTCLDVFGKLGPILSKFVNVFSRAVSLALSMEKGISRGEITLIDSLAYGKEEAAAFETILKGLLQVFLKVQKGFMISELMKQFAPLLADLITIIGKNNKIFKGLTNLTVDSVSKILHKFQHGSSGPYDSTFFSFVDNFFATCFLHNHAGLRNSAISAWKHTFDHSRDLKYTDVFKKALLKIGKRYALYMPDNLNCNDNDDEDLPLSTFLKKPTTTPKRVFSIIDEDSTDYIPITTSANKKIKLTDHQKEMFTATKDKLPFYDEDSMQSAMTSRLKSLPSNFDVDNSRTGLSNTALSNLEKVSLKKEHSDNDKNEEPRFRRTAIRLNFDELVTNTEGSSSTESDNVKSDESADETKESTSRRTRAKSTPSRYTAVSRKRAISETTKKEEQSSTVSNIGTPKRRGRPAKSSKAKRIDIDSVKAAERGAVNKQQTMELKEDTDGSGSVSSVTGSSESLSSQSDPTEKIESIEAPEIDKGTDSIRICEDSNSTPEKSYPIDKISTPSTIRVIEAHTPGILKKINSPSTSERKRLRVHFHDISALNSDDNSNMNLDEQGNNEQLSNDNFMEFSSGNVDSNSQSDGPIFPDLKDSKDPVAKLISKLVPVANGGTFLKRALKIERIQTIGDLASLPKKKISSLPIRIPRVQSVISVLQAYTADSKVEFIQSNELDELPLKEAPKLDMKCSESPEKLTQLKIVQESSKDDTISDNISTVLNDAKALTEHDTVESPCFSGSLSYHKKLMKAFNDLSSIISSDTVDNLAPDEAREAFNMTNTMMQVVCNLQKDLLLKL